jgi:hypothetical protein
MHVYVYMNTCMNMNVHIQCYIDNTSDPNDIIYVYVYEYVYEYIYIYAFACVYMYI